MIESSDALYISRVPNPDIWLNQLLAGEIDYQDETANLEAVQSEVFMIERTKSGFGRETFLGQYNLFTPYIPDHE